MVNVRSYNSVNVPKIPMDKLSITVMWKDVLMVKAKGMYCKQPRVLVREVTLMDDGEILLIMVVGHWPQSSRLLDKIEKMMFVDDEMKDKVGPLRAPIQQTGC